MAEKVTVEEINGTLALERMKHRERLLSIIKGDAYQTVCDILIVIIPCTTLGWLYSFAAPLAFIPLFLSLIILAKSRDRRFKALVELLDLEKNSPLQT
ncbi:MAG: hypothetical protein B9S32_03100 [Verrucomicrobia bacterium Tous-C9LFEB]|nr:MAG: hypothetical protein B9S32_03100 [Verrucomicrobia bacterium Tous-C9LFEB]